MYLKSLELMGFKSFGRKTVFDFQPGVTAIIGPNGSGKSNVCDAIRWVLGEQSPKALRGTKMSEVIFAGSSEFRPSAFAQVKLILNNEDHAMPLDYSEVSIGRQLFRSGESNYMVNNSRSLLSSVKEMLMDTGIGKDGYSVIGQGDIDDIVFQRTQSRRNLIEEAAGITKFKHRKQSTLAKLEHTQTNITRLKDIIAEIETQLGPLAEQAEKTRKYQNLAAEIRQLEIDLILFDLNQYYAEHENLNSMKMGLMAKVEEIDRFLAEVDAKKSDAKLKYAEFEDAIKIRQDQVKEFTAQIDERKQKISVFREEIKSKEARSQAILEEVEGLKIKLLEGADEISEAENRFSDEDAREIEITGAISEIETSMTSVKSELDEHLKAQADDKNSVYQLAVKITERKNRITSVTEQITFIERQLEKGETEVENARENIKKLTEETQKLEKDIAEMTAEITENTAQQTDELTRLRTVERDCHKNEEELLAVSDQIKILNARNNMLDEIRHSSESGIYRGVQAALALKETGRLPGIFGIVGDLIKVPAGYETAFETALGTSIQDIITKDSETAKAAIAALKANKAGRATFLPLDIMTAPPTIARPNVKGCLGVALDLISFEARFYTVMSNLLGRILIFDNLDNAVEFTRNNRNFNRIVTVDGEVVRSSGAMTGGGEARKSGGILSRKREQEELETKLASCLSKETKLKSLIGSLQKERQRLQTSTRERDDIIRRSEQSLSFFSKTLTKNKSELSAKNEDFSNVARDRAELTTRLEGFRKESVDASSELEVLEGQNLTLTSKLNLNSDRENLIQSRLTALNGMIGDKKLALAQVVERKKAIRKEIESAGKRRKEAEDRQTRATEEVGQLKTQIAENTTKLSVLQLEVDEFDKRKQAVETATEEIQTEYRKMSKEIDQLDHAYQSRVKMQESSRKKVNELDIRLAEIKTHISTKEGTLSADFSLTVNDIAVNLRKYESRDELSIMIVQKKAEQEALEPVNPLAIEDYEKTKERHTFLSAQITDMSEAAASLEQVIAEIEKISAERFLETLGQINTAFSDIFEILFPTGSGALKLADKERPLESDVDIVCKLPGKKLTTIELFSGGEKSLIALALLFSILQVKPPAFCLLDEVEAALDEANVKRFTRMLKSFADKTQFLVITHNKETMQAVDVIYGITMQKTGLSRPISIRIEDENKIKEFTVAKSGQVSSRSLTAEAGDNKTQ